MTFLYWVLILAGAGLGLLGNLVLPAPDGRRKTWGFWIVQASGILLGIALAITFFRFGVFPF